MPDEYDAREQEIREQQIAQSAELELTDPDIEQALHNIGRNLFIIAGWYGRPEGITQERLDASQALFALAIVLADFTIGRPR